MQPFWNCSNLCISLAIHSSKHKHHRTTQAVKWSWTLWRARGTLVSNWTRGQLPWEGKRVSCEDWCASTSPPSRLPTCLGRSTEERTALTTRCQTSTCSETFWRMNSTFNPQTRDEKRKAKCTNVKPPLPG